MGGKEKRRDGKRMTKEGKCRIFERGLSGIYSATGFSEGRERGEKTISDSNECLYNGPVWTET